MTHRVGIFLVVISGLLFVYFIAALGAEAPNIPVCLGAGICLLIGSILAISYSPKPKPAGRFRTINKFRSTRKK